MQNLDKIELLKELTPQERAGIASKCAWRTFGANEQILERSTDSRDMFFVVEGSVNIVNYGVSGREVTYASVGEGQYFGELSAIDGHARSANVVANTRCLLASLSPELFQELLMQNPAIMMSVLQRLVRIIRINDDRILDLSTLGGCARNSCAWRSRIR